MIKETVESRESLILNEEPDGKAVCERTIKHSEIILFQNGKELNDGIIVIEKKRFSGF